jgi:hypothetical protein
MSNLSRIGLFSFSLLSVVLLVFLIIQLTEKRTYKCFNGTCSKSKQGDFSTMTACQTYCKNCEPPNHPPGFNPSPLTRDALIIRDALCPTLDSQNKCQTAGCAWQGQNPPGPFPSTSSPSPKPLGPGGLQCNTLKRAKCFVHPKCQWKNNECVPNAPSP